MNKIFYDPETLQIKGFSDGDISMIWPYIETDHPIHETYSVRIIAKDETVELVFKESFTDEEWNEIING